MNNFRKFNQRMIMIVCIGLMIYTSIQAGQIENLENSISELDYHRPNWTDLGTRMANMEYQYFVNLGLINRLEEVMWLEGYEHTVEESMPHMNNRLLLKDFRYMMSNRFMIQNLDNQINFPYVSQLGIFAPREEDCGPAAISMVTQFYGVDNNHTLRWIHDWMVGGDLPTNYVHIVDMLESYYGLNTEVITTYAPIKVNLSAQGFAGAEDITVIDVDDFPNDVPVIWIYQQTPHWIVRYQGWAYDPQLGIRHFETTENIYRPDYGLGIIVR